MNWIVLLDRSGNRIGTLKNTFPHPYKGYFMTFFYYLNLEKKLTNTTELAYKGPNMILNTK